MRASRLASYHSTWYGGCLISILYSSAVGFTLIGIKLWALCILCNLAFILKVNLKVPLESDSFVF